jgi:hypothetical protein
LLFIVGFVDHWSDEERRGFSREKGSILIDNFGELAGSVFASIT